MYIDTDKVPEHHRLIRHLACCTNDCQIISDEVQIKAKHMSRLWAILSALAMLAVLAVTHSL